MSIATRRLSRSAVLAVLGYSMTSSMLKIGAGGMVTGLQIAADGTKVIHTDVYGDYGWDTALDKWRLDHTASSMDDSLWMIGENGTTARAIAPSQPSRQYKAVWDHIWKSDDYGVTWQAQQGSIAMYPNCSTRAFGHRLVVDPINPDHALFGSTRHGLWRTVDGSTWQQVVSVPTGIPASWPLGSGAGKGQYSSPLWSDATYDYNGYGVGPIAFNATSGQTAGRTSEVAVGIQGQGVWRSTDGGSTWTQLSGTPYVFSPERLAYAPNGDLFVVTPRQTYAVLMAATSGTYTLSIDGNTTAPIAYDATYTDVQSAVNALGAPYNGSVDVYPWDIRGATYGIWNRTNNGITITIDATGLSGGTATVVDYTSNQWSGLKVLQRLHLASWGEAVPSSWSSGEVSFAVDYLQPGRIVIMQSAGFDHPRLLQVSTDYGVSWGFTTNQAVSTPDDVPWLNEMLIQDPTMWVSVICPVFDTVSTNTLWVADGFGVRKIMLSDTSNSPTASWRSQGRGIEELVGNDIKAMADGSVVCASWDRPIARSVDRSVYPNTLLPDLNFNSGWSLSRPRSNSSFVAAAITNHQDGGRVSRSGFSTDNGATWTAYQSIPAGSTNGFATFGFGQIVASSPTNHLWVSTAAHGVYYTTDQGVSWSAVTLPNGADPTQANDRQHYTYRRPACSDGVNSFYLFVRDAGVFHSADGGVSWNRQCTAASMPAADYWWNVHIYATPGKVGDLWLICGLTTYISAGVTYEIKTNPTMHSTDGGATWTVVPALQSIDAIGFGLPMPGKTEPTMLCYGFLDGTQKGLLVSTDGGVTWQWLQKWAAGHFAEVRSIDGDLTTPGVFYLARAGLGYTRIVVS